MLKNNHSGPVVLGDLRNAGKLIEIGCTKCWHIVYADPHTLPFPDHEAVPAVYQRMKCSKCGCRAGYSRPDARVHGVDGRRSGA